MRFSSLIQILQTGDAGLLWSQPGTDPLLAGAAHVMEGWEGAGRDGVGSHWMVVCVCVCVCVCVYVCVFRKDCRGVS